MHPYGIEKVDWLRKYIKLANGIPSHDKISRVFERLNPKTFQECFISWVQSVVANSKIIHLSILMGNGYVIAAKMAVNQ